MKTRTAPWDYERNTGVAEPDGTCPICSSPAYTAPLPDDAGTLVTCCGGCGTYKTPMTAAEINLEQWQAETVETQEAARPF